MTRSRRLNPEASLVSTIRDYCNVKGLPYLRLESGDKDKAHRGRGATVGCPDIAILLPTGHTLWVETKAPKGRLRESQMVFAARCAQFGVPHVVARKLEDLYPWTQ